MNVSIQTTDLSIGFEMESDDETKIEEVIGHMIPLTPAIQAAINAKYGTMADRQARKTKLSQAENRYEKLLDRVAELEAKIAVLERK